MIRIDIENTELIARMSKANKPFYLQEAFAHLIDRNGQPERYPQRIEIFADRDPSGNAIAHPVGKYSLSPDSFRVTNGRLELGFVNLQPIKQQAKAA